MFDLSFNLVESLPDSFPFLPFGFLGFSFWLFDGALFTLACEIASPIFVPGLALRIASIIDSVKFARERSMVTEGGCSG